MPKWRCRVADVTPLQNVSRNWMLNAREILNAEMLIIDFIVIFGLALILTFTGFKIQTISMSLHQAHTIHENQEEVIQQFSE
jgi:hypothetical protein